MTVVSHKADALVKKAEKAFELGLISEETLEYVTKQAYTNPAYNGMLELPFDWDIEAEERARRKAAIKFFWLKLFRRVK